MYPNGLFVGEVDFGGGLLEVGHTLAGYRAYVGRIRDVECFPECEYDMPLTGVESDTEALSWPG